MTLKLKNLIAVFLLTQLWSAFVISSAALVEKPSSSPEKNGVNSNDKPESGPSPNPESPPKESPSETQTKLTTSSSDKVSTHTAQEMALPVIEPVKSKSSSSVTAISENQSSNTQPKISDPPTSAAETNLNNKEITPNSSATTMINSNNSKQENQEIDLNSLFFNPINKLVNNLSGTISNNIKKIEFILTQASDIVINFINISWGKLGSPLPDDLPDLNKIRNQILQTMLNVLDNIIKTVEKNKVTSTQTSKISITDLGFPIPLLGSDLFKNLSMSNSESKNSYAQDSKKYLELFKSATQLVVDEYSKKLKSPFNQVNAPEIIQNFLLESMKPVLDSLNQSNNLTDIISPIVKNIQDIKKVLKIPG